MRGLSCALLYWLLANAWWQAPAQAQAQRFAVIVANNRGLSSDEPLRYAVADGERVYSVLREIGGFLPSDVVLLRDEPAESLRQTLAALQARTQGAGDDPVKSSLILVYYSGHADAKALHMRDSSFALSELEQFAHTATASVRMVVLDACQSGALTRVKGGRVGAAFVLPPERELGTGEVFLTASAASEDAQESDELRGSFFTHAFVSGLLGVADADGDGAIALDEAYRHAYQATLRATSRTRSGTQHPTYAYDLRGAGHVILTWPQRYARERAELHFPNDLGFLIMRDAADGLVVAELSERASTRKLSLLAGRYFVRGRGQAVMYEGLLEAPAARVTEVSVESLARVDYAKLVRKGRSEHIVAHSLEAGLRARTPLPGSMQPCLGGFLGYGMDFAQLGVRARLAWCRTTLHNAALKAELHAYDLELRLHHVWDVSALWFELSLGGGTSLWNERFVTRNVAPPRTSIAPFLTLGAAVGVDFPAGWYAGLDAAAETHFISLQHERSDPSVLAAGFALRGTLLAGRRF